MRKLEQLPDDNISVDIIVRAKDGHELTKALLESMRENQQENLFTRVILVDDGSDPPYKSQGWFAGPCTHIATHPKPLGAVSATNTGLEYFLMGDSDYVLILDNDTEIPKGDTLWLVRWINELENSGAGAAAATTNYASKRQHILRAPQTYTADWKTSDGQRGGLKGWPEEAAFVSFAVLIKRNVIEECGLWDERYNPGNYEDDDYAITMRVAGHKVVVAQSVYIEHKGHKTFGPQLHELLAENLSRFVEKWGMGRLWDLGWLTDDALMQALVAKRRLMAGG